VKDGRAGVASARKRITAPQPQVLERKMKFAASGGQTVVNGAPAGATEAASISSDNFKDMGTWFKTLMSDTTA
jgi:hypothetical protein